jgi:ABC-type bacteriocin/lantibiotic exporter with double-glycine peptidase domain
MGGTPRMKAADAPLRGAGRAITADLTKKKKPELKKVLPEVWKLVKPRKWLIAGSFLLMIINRLCSLVLPISSRPFINDVMRRER